MSNDSDKHTRTLTTKQASLATGIFNFILGLAFFALLYGTFNLVVTDFFSGAGLQAQGDRLTQTQDYVQTAWVNLPFIAVVFLSIGLITRAAFESRGGAG